MNYRFCKPLATGGVEYAPLPLDTGHGITWNPDEAMYNAIGYYRMANNAPEQREGYAPVASRYEVRDNQCVTVWDYQPLPVEQMVAMYDAEMEAHITATRNARGYTTREPSAYAQSTNPRFAQDALDWAAFIDAVMAYGLNVQNDYAETGVAPTLAEFKAGLPVIHWTVEG